MTIVIITAAILCNSENAMSLICISKLLIHELFLLSRISFLRPLHWGLLSDWLYYLSSGTSWLYKFNRRRLVFWNVVHGLLDLYSSNWGLRNWLCLLLLLRTTFVDSLLLSILTFICSKRGSLVTLSCSLERSSLLRLGLILDIRLI